MRRGPQWRWWPVSNGRGLEGRGQGRGASAGVKGAPSQEGGGPADPDEQTLAPVVPNPNLDLEREASGFGAEAEVPGAAVWSLSLGEWQPSIFLSRITNSLLSVIFQKIPPTASPLVVQSAIHDFCLLRTCRPRQHMTPSLSLASSSSLS